jgi:hypothetical protein
MLLCICGGAWLAGAIVALAWEYWRRRRKGG